MFKLETDYASLETVIVAGCGKPKLENILFVIKGIFKLDLGAIRN